jgi:hypothetical protein
MSPSRRVRYVPCLHCGYNLDGCEPPDRFHPLVLKCPECGNATDYSKAPFPPVPAWPTITAVLAGSATMILVGAIADHLTHGFRSTGSALVFLPTVFGCIPAGGVVSMAIVWRRRLRARQWERGIREMPARLRRSLLLDLAFCCVLNTALVIVLLALYFNVIRAWLWPPR